MKFLNWLKRLRRKPIVLYGGRKPVKVESIARKKILGKGEYEGVVYEVEVVVKGDGKRRKIALAEKKFRGKPEHHPPFRNPVRQFEIMQELLKLNRKKKLGLRIVPTIRLRRRKGHLPTLVITKLDVAEKKPLPFRIPKKQYNEKQYNEFNNDAMKQREIANREGYYIGMDAFEPVLDKKTGKMIAVIVDFGNIRKSW